MKYLILLVFLAPAVMGQGLLEVLEGTECENLYSAIRDAMESPLAQFFEPRDFFSSIGLSLDNKKQLKRFACQLPDVTTITELAKISPINDYSEVAKKYLEMMKVKEIGVKRFIKMLKLYVTINENGRFLPADITNLPWYVGKNEALNLFSLLVRDFGPDFPTFFMNHLSTIQGEVFNMTDVPQFIDALYKYDSVDNVASYLQVKPRLLEAFLELLYIASNTDSSTIQMYKRTYILMERLDEIEFYNLSIL